MPYMVDATQDPIDFKKLDHDHVKRCATATRCGICGGKIRQRPFAFIGPNDGRTCFAEPWMHQDCATLAMAQCPFLKGKPSPRYAEQPLVADWQGNMAMFVADQAEAHRDPHGVWHFKAVTKLRLITNGDANTIRR